MGDPISDFTDLAGGHRKNFKVTKDGACVIKLSNLREGHFYAWLHALSRSFLTNPAQNVPGAEVACWLQSANIVSVCSHQRSSEKGVPCQAFSSSCCIDSCPFGCDEEGTENECPLLLLKVSTICQDMGKRDCTLLHSKALISWIPRLFGACVAEASTRVAEMNSPKILLKMENLLFGIRNPVVIDFKMGTQLYGDDAPLDKRQRAARYSVERGAIKLGISFSGLWGRINGEEFRWEGGSRAGGQKGTSKIPTTIEEYVKLLEAFLLTSGKQGIAAGRSIIAKLHELKCIFQLQTFVAFHGSSLLIVLDAEDCQHHLVSNTDRVGGHLECSISRHVKVKMIDFAHVTIGKNQLDTGYLQGIRTLINVFDIATNLLEKRDAPVYGWQVLDNLRCNSFIIEGEKESIS